MSPLHSAASAGDLDLLRRLLEAGAEIDCRDDATGATPLITACLSPRAGPDVMEFLLDHGADIHARARRFGDEEEPLVALAIASSHASCEKTRLLLGRGADINYRSTHGYTLLTWAACQNKPELVVLLVSLGAPLDGESIHRESALSVLSRQGRFEEIAKLLAHGADPSPLKWTPLHRATALGTLEDLRIAMEKDPDLEALDFWERTAFLLSLQTSDPAKPALLLSHGANRFVTGRCEKPPFHYAIERDDGIMLDWLIGEGFDLAQTGRFNTTLLEEAVENRAVACFHRLLAAGLDWRQPGAYGDPLIKDATHPEIIQTLVDLGASLGDLELRELRNWIGLGNCDDLRVSEEEFRKNRTRRFATHNPETMDVPFWRAMVRNGWDGYQAASHFGDSSFDQNNPVWCHQRFGMSLTVLPDGRFIQIAGEHEDSYDPDFCIYNDVIIHDGKGGFEILGYPEEVFPPTDFHSATLVGKWIYIIGNLGYPETRKAHGYETPVYRFHTLSGKIERVTTTGKSPGWIHSHDAKAIDGGILISGGKKYGFDENGKGRIDDHAGTYFLDLKSGCWRLVDDTTVPGGEGG